MTKLSTSKQRHTFQINNLLDNEPAVVDNIKTDYNNSITQMYIDMLDKENEKTLDPQWAINNMEYDLRTTDWILEKARASEVYSQNLYAAMCNRDFQKKEVLPILKNKTWSCSWRYAGGIVAHMREEGDYINWYCSGILDPHTNIDGYVREGEVTAEIREDLLKLGWVVLDE